MEFFSNLSLGFETALTLQNLGFAFIGVLIGTLVGVLPGLGPTATVAMLLPVTFALPPLTGLIMLAGIYYGAQYGGSTTSILVNIPGEVASVVTCIDGYEMAKQGRGGVALATAALGSFFAGTVGTLLIAAFAPMLAKVAFSFGPPEYFSLMVLGLVGAIVLASGSMAKAFAMTVLGMVIGLIGTDVNSGKLRYTLGSEHFYDGIDMLVVAMGLFALVEVARNVESREKREVFTNAITSLWPSRTDFGRMIPPILRGTGLGSLLGLLPGGGAALASFIAYAVEKKSSRNSAEFGRGAIEGVAAPEAANNAGAQTAFIPLLTLGIPPTALMALLLGAMTVHDIQPGPQVMTSNPTLFWGLIASMWIGNAMLVILNLPLVGIWVKLLTVPYRLLYPAILLFCCVGVYSVENNTFDVMLMAVFGLIGYVFYRLGCEPAPLILGFVLGPLVEENFRRSLVLARGDFTVFLTRPLSLALLVMAAIAVVVVLAPAIKRKREIAFQEET